MDAIVKTIDVGQAMCTIVIKDKRALMFDSGNYWDAKRISEVLEEYKVKQYSVVISHYDSDHVNGLIELLKNCDESPELKNIYAPDAPNSINGIRLKMAVEEYQEKYCRTVHYETLSKAKAKNINITKIGHLRLIRPDSESDTDENYNNMLAVLNVHNQNLVFPGDTIGKTEGSMLEAMLNSPHWDDGCLYMISPHHGSDHADRYISKMYRPKITVAQAIKGQFGHPSNSIVCEYKNRGQFFLNQQSVGEVELTISPEGNAKIKIEKIIKLASKLKSRDINDLCKKGIDVNHVELLNNVLKNGEVEYPEFLSFTLKLILDRSEEEYSNKIK